MANVINRSVKVTLTADEYNFIKWLAKRDKVKITTELKQIFYTELGALSVLYEGEFNADTNK